MPKFNEYSTKHIMKKRWQKVLTVLSAIVVFCTTYALILPAITMEGEVYCGYEAKHTDACYEEVQKLVCELAEEEGHVHTVDCYREEQTLVGSDNDAESEYDDSTQKVLICGKEEQEGHKHNEACYITEKKLICGHETHEHTLQCYSNPEADVEDSSVWERITKVELSGDIGKDVVSVAKTQIGYEESSRNYHVLKDGKTKKGYTRYGDWYGDKYGDWSAMFCSFCLNYADVSTKQVPRAADSEEWIRALKERDQYKDADYEPQEGDIVFLKNGNCGIIGGIEKNKITVIEGDSGDQVNYNTYNMNKGQIRGYGVVTVKKIPALKAMLEQPAYALESEAAVEIAAEPTTEPTEKPVEKPTEAPAAEEIVENDTIMPEIADANSEKLSSEEITVDNTDEVEETCEEANPEEVLTEEPTEDDTDEVEETCEEADPEEVSTEETTVGNPDEIEETGADPDPDEDQDPDDPEDQKPTGGLKIVKEKPDISWRGVEYSSEEGMHIPRLFQGDYRTVVCYYNGIPRSVATSGCGPTSLSMVIAYLTDNIEQNPYVLFRTAVKAGKYYGNGLSHETLSWLAEKYDVHSEWIENDAEAIVEALKSGKPVIAHMGPGNFTSRGHYMVLRGVTKNGKILVNDPASGKKTEMAFPVSMIVDQARRSNSFMVCWTDAEAEADPAADEDYDYIVEENMAWVSKARVTMKYVGSSLNIRKESDKDSQWLGKLDDGDEVIVLKSGEKWMKINTQDDITGYVLTQNLTILEEKLGTAIVVLNDEGSYLSMRQEADAESEYLGSLDHGTRVCVVSANAEWTKIVTEDLTVAYVHSRYLRGETVQISEAESETEEIEEIEEPEEITDEEPTAEEETVVEETVAEEVNIDEAVEAAEEPEAVAYGCGLEEHVHTKPQCYNGKGDLVCKKTEHVHDDSCLIAPDAPEEPEEVVYYCGLAGHTHTEECLNENGELICGFEEHMHTDACLRPREFPDDSRIGRTVLFSIEQNTDFYARIAVEDGKIALSASELYGINARVVGVYLDGENNEWYRVEVVAQGGEADHFAENPYVRAADVMLEKPEEKYEEYTLTSEDGTNVQLCFASGMFDVMPDAVSIENLSEESNRELFAMLEENGVNGEALMMFDIKLYADGEEVEPNGNVDVTIETPKLDGENYYTMWYLDPERDIVEAMPTAIAGSASVTFTTSHFSTYSLTAQSGKKVTATVNAEWNQSKRKFSTITVVAQSSEQDNAYFTIDTGSGSNWTTGAVWSAQTKKNTPVSIDATSIVNAAAYGTAFRAHVCAKTDEPDKNSGYSTGFTLMNLLEEEKHGFATWLESQTYTISTNQDLYNAFAVYYDIPVVTVGQYDVGEDSVLCASYTGGTGRAYTYQWQYDDNGAWRNISDATNSTLAVASPITEGSAMRCELLENGNVVATSNSYTVKSNVTPQSTMDGSVDAAWKNDRVSGFSVEVEYDKLKNNSSIVLSYSNDGNTWKTIGDPQTAARDSTGFDNFKGISVPNDASAATQFKVELTVENNKKDYYFTLFDVLDACKEGFKEWLAANYGTENRPMPATRQDLYSAFSMYYNIPVATVSQYALAGNDYIGVFYQGATDDYLYRWEYSADGESWTAMTFTDEVGAPNEVNSFIIDDYSAELSEGTYVRCSMYWPDADELTSEYLIDESNIIQVRSSQSVTDKPVIEAHWDSKSKTISDFSATTNNSVVKDSSVALRYSDNNWVSGTIPVTVSEIAKVAAAGIQTLSDSSGDSANDGSLGREWKIISQKDKTTSESGAFTVFDILDACKAGFQDWLVERYVQEFEGGSLPTNIEDLYKAFDIYYNLPEATIRINGYMFETEGEEPQDHAALICDLDRDYPGAEYAWEIYDTKTGEWKPFGFGATGTDISDQAEDQIQLSVIDIEGKDVLLNEKVRCKISKDIGGNDVVVAISNDLVIDCVSIDDLKDKALQAINEGLHLSAYPLAVGTAAATSTTADLRLVPDVTAKSGYNLYNFYWTNLANDSRVGFIPRNVPDGEDPQTYYANAYIDHLKDVYVHKGIDAVKKEWEKYLYDIFDPSSTGKIMTNVTTYPSYNYGDQYPDFVKDQNSTSFHSTASVKPTIEKLNYDFLENGVDYSNFISGLNKEATAVDAGDANTERKYLIDITADAQAKATAPVAMILQIQTAWQLFDLKHANAQPGEGKTEVGSASYNTQLANLYDIKQALLRFVDYMENKYPGNNLVLGITETRHDASQTMFLGKDRNGKDLYVTNDYTALRNGISKWDTFGNCEHVHYDSDTLEDAVENLSSNLSAWKDMYGNEIAYKDIQKVAVVIGGPTEDSGSTNGYGCVLPWSDFATNGINSVYGIRVNKGTSVKGNPISWLEYSGNNGPQYNNGTGTGFTQKFEAWTEDAVFNALVTIAEQEMLKKGLNIEAEDKYVEDVVVNDTVEKEFLIDPDVPFTATIYNSETFGDDEEKGKKNFETVIDWQTGVVTAKTYSEGEVDDTQTIQGDRTVSTVDGTTTTTITFTATQPVKYSVDGNIHTENVNNEHTLTVVEHADKTADITYDFGKVYNTKKCNLNFGVVARDNYLGSNNVYTNIGTPDLTYWHNSDEYGRICPDTPQVNVPIRFSTVDGGEKTVLVGTTVDLGTDTDLNSTQIPAVLEELVGNYRQTNGTVTYEWYYLSSYNETTGEYVTGDLIHTCGSTKVVNGEPEGFSPLNYDFLVDSIGEQNLVLVVKFTPEEIDETSANFKQDDVTNVAVNEVAHYGKEKIIGNDPGEHYTFRISKAWDDNVADEDRNPINFILMATTSDDSVVRYVGDDNALVEDEAQAHTFTINGTSDPAWKTTITDLDTKITIDNVEQVLVYSAIEQLGEDAPYYWDTYDLDTETEVKYAPQLNLWLKRAKGGEINKADAKYLDVKFTYNGTSYTQEGISLDLESKISQNTPLPYSIDVSSWGIEPPADGLVDISNVTIKVYKQLGAQDKDREQLASSIDADHPMTISSVGVDVPIQIINITNKKVIQPVKFRKMSDGDDRPVGGAEFVMYGSKTEGGEEVIDESKTEYQRLVSDSANGYLYNPSAAVGDPDAEGSYEFDLVPGTYFLKEVKVPAGYERKLVAPFKITVDKDGVMGVEGVTAVTPTVVEGVTVYNLTVYNHKSTVPENPPSIHVDPQSPDPEITIAKQIDYLGDNGLPGMDDLYKLYLSLESGVDPIDLLLVIDESASMAEDLAGAESDDPDFDGTSRAKHIEDFLNGTNDQDGFIAKFMKAHPENDLAVMTFGSDSSITKRYQVEWGQGSAATKITLHPDGATNYTAALDVANEIWEAKADSDNQKIMIFLSDGEPTYAYSDGKLHRGQTDGEIVGFGDYYTPEEMSYLSSIRAFLDAADFDASQGESVHSRRESYMNVGTASDDNGVTIPGYADFVSFDNQDGPHFPEVYKVSNFDMDVPGLSEWLLGDFTDVTEYQNFYTDFMSKSDAEKQDWLDEHLLSVGDYYDLFKLTEISYAEFVRNNPDVNTFTIGYSSDLSGTYTSSGRRKDEVLKYMSGNDGYVYCGDSESIESGIMSFLALVENITITDSLSEYVDLAANPDLEITLAVGNEEPLVLYENSDFTHAGNEYLDTAQVKLNADDGLKLVFKKGVLSNFKCVASFNVTPSATAYLEYAQNAVDDPNDPYAGVKGDAGTDYLGDPDDDTDDNDTSSEKPGFYSNDEAEAEWEIGGVPDSDEYDKPVVQVTPLKLTVRKKVIAGDSGTTQFGFKVTVTDSKGDPMNIFTDPNGTGLTNVFEFSLAHGESRDIDVPKNANVVVQETEHAGYTTAIVADPGSENQQSHDGDEFTQERLSSDLTLEVQNNPGIELPHTGGTGTTLYYALGVLLMAGALMCGCVLRRTRERRYHG